MSVYEAQSRENCIGSGHACCQGVGAGDRFSLSFPPLVFSGSFLLRSSSALAIFDSESETRTRKNVFLMWHTDLRMITLLDLQLPTIRSWVQRPSPSAARDREASAQVLWSRQSCSCVVPAPWQFSVLQSHRPRNRTPSLSLMLQPRHHRRPDHLSSSQQKLCPISRILSM